MIKLSKVPRIELDRALLDRTISKIADEVRLTIRQRTKSGLDVSGNPFKAYKSKAYKEYKKKHSRTGEKVNLELTRNMLESLGIVKVALAWYRIYIKDEMANIYGYAHHKGTGNMPKREWFGVNKETEDKIYKKHFFGLNIGKFR